jgi:predicted SnoaL-like aldol condensation-catalyzing enzyme
MKVLIALVVALASTSALSQVVSSKDGQQTLLRSESSRLEANKKLVYDMYREIVQGGHAELAEKYFTKEYIQHNPNVASGRDALVAYLRGSRPARDIQPTITLPFITIVAERDMVIVASERRETDKEGKPYNTTWFDMYRIENGKIAEHWDPALKTESMKRFDPNVSTSLK